MSTGILIPYLFGGTLIVFLASYLIGSVPFGLVLTRLSGMGDIRGIGSGNIGATNVLRTGRKDIAALTLLLDMLKGTLAVSLVPLLLQDTGISYFFVAALGVFAGHLWPVWLKLRGGKGVATYLGIILALSPFTGFGFVVIWLSVFSATKYSSLSAVIAALVAPVIAAMLGNQPVALLLFILALFLIFKHKENIRRLLNGTESKISFKNE